MSPVKNNIEETIDVGFFRSVADLSKKHPGRLARKTEGQLQAVMLGSRIDQFTRGVGDTGSGETWLFSGEKGQYILIGTQGRSSESAQRGNLLGGYEEFVSQRFGVEAVFRVHEEFPYGEKNPFPAISGDIMFDAFNLASSRIALWAGLEDVDDVNWPPQRPQRVKRAKVMSTIGELSTYTGGNRDIFGISSQTWDVLDVQFRKSMPLEAMYHYACIVHDFINLTLGKFVPMSFTAFSPRDHSISRGHTRRFELISQGRRFRPKKGEGSTLTPMLSLDDLHGLKGLSVLIDWCQKAEPNSVILNRVAAQKNGQEAFSEHWRTLNMIHKGRQSEKTRISKLVDDVGKSLVRSILPINSDIECWLDSIAGYRNKVVAHPSGHGTLDSRMLYQGPVFTQQMEFLLKAYVLRKGVGVRFENERSKDALLHNVNGDWGQWDWRSTGKSYALY